MSSGAEAWTFQRRATIACPHCGSRRRHRMPTDACLYFHVCRSCQTLLRPKPGDCCVFCSFGSAPCPPVQQARRADAEAKGC